jgi:hypothetical protein
MEGRPLGEEAAAAAAAVAEERLSSGAAAGPSGAEEAEGGAEEADEDGGRHYGPQWVLLRFDAPVTAPRVREGRGGALGRAAACAAQEGAVGQVAGRAGCVQCRAELAPPAPRPPLTRCPSRPSGRAGHRRPLRRRHPRRGVPVRGRRGWQGRRRAALPAGLSAQRAPSAKPLLPAIWAGRQPFNATSGMSLTLRPTLFHSPLAAPTRHPSLAFYGRLVALVDPSKLHELARLRVFKASAPRSQRPGPAAPWLLHLHIVRSALCGSPRPLSAAGARPRMAAKQVAMRCAVTCRALLCRSPSRAAACWSACSRTARRASCAR